MSSESSAEAISERELEEIEKSAHGYRMGVQRYGFSRTFGRERDVEDLTDEILDLVKEVRRSHAEVAELKERLVECTDRRARLAQALGIDELLPWEDAKLEISKWEEVEKQNAELRERVGGLAGALDKVSNCAPPCPQTGRFYLVPEYLFEEVRAALSRVSAQAKLETRSQEESRRRSEAMEKPEVES